MKMDVKKEVAAFVLQGSSYNGCGEPVEVNYAELRAAAVGEKWEGYDDHNCGRAVHNESAEVVYKTTQGGCGAVPQLGDDGFPRPAELGGGSRAGLVRVRVKEEQE